MLTAHSLLRLAIVVTLLLVGCSGDLSPGSTGTGGATAACRAPR